MATRSKILLSQTKLFPSSSLPVPLKAHPLTTKQPMSRQTQATEPVTATEDLAETGVHCEGCGRWFPSQHSRSFTAHLPHCSNILIELRQADRESSLIQPGGAQPGGLVSVTGLITQSQETTHLPSDPPASNSFAESHDSHQSDDVGLEPSSTHPCMSTVPFKKNAHLPSPESAFQSALLDTLQRNGASLKCHDDIIDIINDGLRRGTLSTKILHSNLASHSPVSSRKHFK